MSAEIRPDIASRSAPLGSRPSIAAKLSSSGRIIRAARSDGERLRSIHGMWRLPS